MIAKNISEKIQLEKVLFIVLCIPLILGIGYITSALTPFYIFYLITSIIGGLLLMFKPRIFLQILIVFMISTISINLPLDFPIRLGLDVILSSLVIVRAIIWLTTTPRENFHLAKVSKIQILFIGSMLLSTLLSTDIIGGISIAVRQISYLSLCLLIPVYFPKAEDVRRLITLILLASIAPLISALWGLFLNIKTLSVLLHRVTYRATVIGDAAGPWALSAFFLVVIAAAYALLLYYQNKKETAKVILLMVFTFALIVGLMSTFYRSAWLGFVVMLLVSSRRKLSLTAFFVIIIGIICLIFPQVWQRVLDAFSTNSTASLRLMMWQWTLQVLLSHPVRLITGYGIAAFYDVLQEIGGAPWDYVLSPHNYYLSVLFNQGIPGLGIFLALLYQIYKLATDILKKSKDPLYRAAAEGILLMLIGISVMSISDSPYGQPSVALYFWVFVAIGIVINNLMISAPDTSAVIIEKN
jgi:putative inorganic carbon (HCO3(-)) transporter